MSNLVWIDPPSGWKYGFPCLWDRDKQTYEELLKEHNYPKEWYDLPCRMWHPTEEDLNANRKQ